MDVTTLSEYWSAMNMIEAQNRLMDIRVSSYPKLKQNKRDELYKELYKSAYPSKKSTKEMSTDELADYLSGLVNG